MLAYSPPLPLIINLIDVYPGMSTEDDEKGLLLALRHRDRVRRIRILASPSKLERLIVTMNEEFQRLEYLYIGVGDKYDYLVLVLPKECQAPHLRHLALEHFALLIGSPLLTTAMGLVTLSLMWIPPSVYFHPIDFLGLISHMPQLEALRITFDSPVPNGDVERQLLLTPMMTHVTLDNLRWFVFGGVSAYLEAVLPRMSIPLLEML